MHDAGRPLIEGNHVFASISSAAETDRAPHGRRTITMSTHVPLRALAGPSSPERDGERAAYVSGVRERMRATVAARAPAWAERIVAELPGSPRTFERFTGRANGAVGGVPRRAGLGQYLGLWPTEVARDLYLVGDSVLFGQSALATAIGGVRTAVQITGRSDPRDQ